MFSPRKRPQHVSLTLVEGIETPEQEIGKRIKERRTELGLSQHALAERMHNLGYEGWQQTTISKIEVADRPLRLNEMADLARALMTSAVRLLEPEPFNAALAKATDDVWQARVQVDRMEWRLKELDDQWHRAMDDLGEARTRLSEAEARMEEAYSAYKEAEIGG